MYSSPPALVLHEFGLNEVYIIFVSVIVGNTEKEQSDNFSKKMDS
jgi:hypothetical protein